MRYFHLIVCQGIQSNSTFPASSISQAISSESFVSEVNERFQWGFKHLDECSTAFSSPLTETLSVKCQRWPHSAGEIIPVFTNMVHILKAPLNLS